MIPNYQGRYYRTWVPVTLICWPYANRIFRVGNAILDWWEPFSQTEAPFRHLTGCTIIAKFQECQSRRRQKKKKKTGQTPPSAVGNWNWLTGLPLAKDVCTLHRRSTAAAAEKRLGNFSDRFASLRPKPKQETRFLNCFCWQKCEPALHKPRSTWLFLRLTVALDSRILSALQLWHLPRRMRRRRLVATGHDYPFPGRRWKLWHARGVVVLLNFHYLCFYFSFLSQAAPLGRAAWVWLAVGLGLQMNAALVCGIHWPGRECQKRIAKKCQRNRSTGILITLQTRIRIEMGLVGGKMCLGRQKK